MKPVYTVWYLSAILHLLFNGTGAYGQVSGKPEITYVSPVPGSWLNHPATNILVRFAKPVLRVSDGFQVRAGSQLIASSYKLLADGHTLLIQPLIPLPANIAIEVLSLNNVLLAGNQTAAPFHFHFYTTNNISKQLFNNEPELPIAGDEGREDYAISDTIANQIPVTVRANNNTSTGYYFLSTLQYNLKKKNRNMILDGNGKIIYDHSANYYTADFKMLNDNSFSYHNWADSTYRILDLNFNEIDTLKAGNGYITDTHDLQYDKHTGHYFLLAQEYVNINMADSVSGGNANAKVLGLIIQEIDENKEVVFEWKTLDHLPITASIGQNLTSSSIDYAHCNSIEVESDTTLLLSSRHLNEIDRIDRRTGAIIWRFGLHAKNNEFTFLNDTLGFTYQHDIRRLPNGNITLFDDGNLRGGSKQYSRAVEYKLDEEKKTATLVWQYRNSPDTYSAFMGNVQRLPNGNSVIGWGGASTIFTEVDEYNNKVLEISMPQMYSYRVFRFDIKNIIDSNQVNLDKSARRYFCKSDSLAVMNNLAKFLIPQKLAPSDSVQIKRTGNTVNIYTKTANDFYNTAQSQLFFSSTPLPLKDTLICKGNTLKLEVLGACSNTRYKWSNNDTLPYIHISPNTNTTYWVDINNGNISRDSVLVRVSSPAGFNISGPQTFAAPSAIDTFRVPYHQASTYTWYLTKGTVISGQDTNTFVVKMDSIFPAKIKSIITNSDGCTNTAMLTVNYKPDMHTLSTVLEAPSFRVYPNPSSKYLFIEGKPGYRYSLSDMSGYTIFSSENKSNDQAIINFEECIPGVYFLHINNGKKMETFKILKMQ